MSVGEGCFQVTSNLNMSQKWKSFKQRYYRNTNILSLCRTVLLSGNVQSEHVAAGEYLKQRYYGNINIFRYCRSMLLSGNIQSEHVAAGEKVQRMILSDH